MNPVFIHSSGRNLRDRFNSPRIFFDLSLFSLLLLVGLVVIRFAGGARLTWINFIKRSVTSDLLRYCDLNFSDARISIPSPVSL